MAEDISVRPSRGGSVAPAAGIRSWRRRYAIILAVSDLLVLIWVVFGTQIAWLVLGFDATLSRTGDPQAHVRDYLIFSLALIGVWYLALTLNDSRNARVIGIGFQEYKRVFDASFVVFGALGIAAFLLRIETARAFLLISLPVGVLLLLLERWLWRRWLRVKRELGEYQARVLLVGSRASTAQIAQELARTPSAGYDVVGIWTPESHRGESDRETGWSVEAALASTGADTVIVTSTDELPIERVKEISWALEAGRQHLVLAPSIVDIAGPRIHTRPVSGLPLIHVETPRFSTGQRLVKRTFDVVSSGLLIVVLSPVLAGVALAVRSTSPGPILYGSSRIGLRGEPFRMLKFRSMRPDADRELAALLAEQGTSEKPLFKIKDDPRITPIGKVLRKYSIDELPQLFNVFGGSMSLVGPRPQIAAEVALYTDAAHRRLLTRPGITGLWQVSGRSTLDWDQTVRIDLYYVENWSLMSDIGILLKTVKAVAVPGETAH